MIDTHAHLYAAEFDADRPEMLQRAKDVGVRQIYLPNIDLASIDAMHRLEDSSNGFCISMMGLHPCSVREDFRDHLAQLKLWLDKRSYAAIGEIGIDLYWDKSTFDIQVEAFVEQIKWGNEYNLPICIHSRESTREVLDVLYANRNVLTGGVLHCFSGSLEEAEEALDLGFYLGFGGSVTYKNTNLVPVIMAVPDECILLETDAPYLTPVPYRGKRNESSYIPIIANRIAEIRGTSVEEISSITTENALRLFGNKSVPGQP